MRPRITTFLLFLSLAFGSRGQYALEGFSLSDTSGHWFDHQIGLQAQEIFTGVFVSLQDRPVIEEASWGEAIWTVGEVFYRGDLYRNVYLLYDLENDVLLTKNHLNSSYFNHSIRLNQEQIDWFRIGADRFVRRHFSDLKVPAAFYHEIFSVESFAFYARRERIRKIETNAIRLEPDDSFYLSVRGDTYSVHNPASVYKLFPELKASLKPVFKSLRIRKFQKATVSQLQQMARRCAPIIIQS